MSFFILLIDGLFIGPLLFQNMLLIMEYNRNNVSEILIFFPDPK